MDAPHASIGREPRRADVELRLPADTAFVTVLRTAAAGLAARLDFTIDDIEDLRMAVSEACALVLPEADDGSDLVTEFFLAANVLTVDVSVAASGKHAPDVDSWPWQVLSALTTDSGSRMEDGRFTVTM